MKIIHIKLYFYSPIFWRFSRASKSALIGDRLTDLISGIKAGIPYLVHTKTGHGIEDRIKVIEFFNTQSKHQKIKPILIDEIDEETLKNIQSFFLN